MKKLLTTLSILFIATASYAQTYTVERVIDGDPPLNPGIQLPKRAFYEDGRLKRQVNLDIDGNGNVTEYYHDGQIKFESYYKIGLLSGISTDYYEDGTLMAITTYKEGVYDGTSKSYHKNGQVQLDAQFENGKPTGTIYQYDPAGNLIMSGDHAELLASNSADGYWSKEDKDRLTQANEYYSTGNFKMAIPILEDLKIKYPDYATTYNLLGSIYYQQNKPEKAVSNLIITLKLLEARKDVPDDNLLSVHRAIAIAYYEWASTTSFSTDISLRIIYHCEEYFQLSENEPDESKSLMLDLLNDAYYYYEFLSKDITMRLINDMTDIPKENYIKEEGAGPESLMEDIYSLEQKLVNKEKAHERLERAGRFKLWGLSNNKYRK